MEQGQPPSDQETGFAPGHRSLPKPPSTGGEIRLDAALLAAEIGAYEWQVESDQLYADAQFMRLFDLPYDKDNGAPIERFLQVIHAEDRARVAERVQHSVLTGEPFREDYRVETTQGQRWVNGRGRMVQDSRGRVVTFYGLVIDITARKQAEQERELIADQMRRMTETYETVLSATNDFAYVFDLKGRFVYANRPLLEMYGRAFHEVIGKTFHELDYPTWHADLHMREIAQVVATKKSLRAEIPFTGANGTTRIYDYIFAPVIDAAGRVEAVAGTTRDVTERKRGEEHGRLLVALDDATRPLASATAITQTSARMLGEHLRVNRCAYADVEADQNTFNLTGDYNLDVPSIVGRYRFDQFGAECLRLMRADEPYVVTDSETDPRTADVRESYRATRIRSVICVPLRKGGQFVAAMAVHQITPRVWLPTEVEIVRSVAARCWESIERARVVRVLAESEKQLQLALETGRLGVWVLDLADKTFTASALCKSIYGWAATAAFSYTDMINGVHPDDRDRVLGSIDRSLREGGEYDLEYQTRLPDGNSHWILVRGQTSMRSDGKPLRMIGVTLDITARKETEREQVRLREEAVRASRAKDDFLATLSHELRTPLNPVLLVASDAAQDVRFPAEARAAFEVVRKNVELEARLIDDLLDLTTIVRGKLAIRKDIRSLHSILRDALAAVKSDFDEKNILLEISLLAPEDRVYADEVRLVQVFINLLKNAAKFTPANGKVRLETRPEGLHEICVHISDTGIGMTRQELGRAFAAFEQGDHANEHGSHRFGGLGLGLAIAQRLVELHHGRITASSEGRDAGTTFTVVVPCSEAKSGEPNPSENKDRLRSESAKRVAGTKVLLVEDHEPTRKTLEHLLKRRDYSVISVGSIADARKSAADGVFDLVVSDLGLPDGDGTELMAELRDRYGLIGIALTGYGMEEDIARCRAAGFVQHLTKPIRVESLESALRECAGISATRS